MSKKYGILDCCGGRLVNPPQHLPTCEHYFDDIYPNCPNNILHVYTDDDEIDTVIAYDEKDAILVWEEHTGIKWEEEFDEDRKFIQRDDNEELSIFIDEDAEEFQSHASIATKLTCKQWVEREGRCFLCSTEF